ncbi:MAG: hypothetical protein ACI9WC_001188 [Arenicella sp.]
MWIGVLIGAASASLDRNWSRFRNRLILSAIVLIRLRACFSLSSLVFTEMSRDTKRFKKVISAPNHS